MAKCDFCITEASKHFIDGNNLCKRCFGRLQDLRVGDSDAIAYFSNPENYLSATPKMKSYMLETLRKVKGPSDNNGELDRVEESMLSSKELSDKKKNDACRNMLITSGFSFDGYKVVKYSGYISGDDVIQVDRGFSVLGFGATNTGSALTDALVKIRRKALQELKEAAYDLGCNAVIGVDFDYITLEPETANITGGTTYLPYVFCVTANGNAVVIEKDETKQSVASIIKEYKELLDCGAITQEEFDAKKQELL